MYVCMYVGMYVCMYVYKYLNKQVQVSKRVYINYLLLSKSAVVNCIMLFFLKNVLSMVNAIVSVWYNLENMKDREKDRKRERFLDM